MLDSSLPLDFTYPESRDHLPETSIPQQSNETKVPRNTYEQMDGLNNNSSSRRVLAYVLIGGVLLWGFGTF